MANGYDNSSAPRRKLLVPVMAALFVAACGLAWWYAREVSSARRRAAAAIVADVRRGGLAAYVLPRSGHIRWFHRSRLTQKQLVGQTGTTMVVPIDETIGWRAVITIAYKDGTFGWLDVRFDEAGRAFYEGQWQRWRLSNDMTSGRFYAGSLTVRGEEVEMSGGLLAEFAPGSVVVHHWGQSGTVETITVDDAFLPPGTLPLTASVMRARKSGGIFQLFYSDLGPDGWSAGVQELALSLADAAEAPPELRGAVDTGITISQPSSGLPVGRMYFNSTGDVLAVHTGHVRERLALTNNRFLTPLGPAPPRVLREAFGGRIWRSSQQLLAAPAEGEHANN